MSNRGYPEEVKTQAVDMFVRLAAHDTNLSRCARQVKEVYGVSRPVLIGWARQAGHDLTPTRHSQQQLQGELFSLRERVEELEADNARLREENQQLRSKNEALTEVLSRAHTTTDS